MDIKSWAVGFIDGEGCLAFSPKQREKGAYRYWVPSLSVQIGSDDYRALDVLDVAIGIKGNRYVRQPSRRVWRTQETIECHWRSREQISAVAALLDKRSLITTKAKEYRWWRKAVALYLCERDPRKREPRMNRYRAELLKARLRTAS